MPLTDMQRDIILGKLPKEIYRAKDQDPISELPDEEEILDEEEIPEATVQELFGVLQDIFEQSNLIVDEILKSEETNPQILALLSEIKGQLLANLKALSLISQGQFDKLPSPEKEEEIDLSTSRITPSMREGESLRSGFKSPRGTSVIE